MGFLDYMQDAIDDRVRRNLDYIREKARKSSDAGLRNWWEKNQYEEGEFADRAREIVKKEMDRRGMYY